MTDATQEFFEALSARRHEPLLGSASGTLRFDLEEGGGVEHWFVGVDHGDVTVSHRRAGADCIVRGSRSLFDEVARGEANAVAAALRGELEIRGDPALVLAFQRLFPGPPTPDQRRTAGYARSRR